MVMDINHLLDLLESLPQGKEFDYVKPSSNKAIFISVDRAQMVAKVQKKDRNGNIEPANISTVNLETIVKNAVEDKPFNFESIFNGSGNKRAVWETVIARTSEFYACYVNNRKHVVWRPQHPHAAGELEFYTLEEGLLSKPNTTGAQVVSRQSNGKKKFEDMTPKERRELYRAYLSRPGSTVSKSKRSYISGVVNRNVNKICKALHGVDNAYELNNVEQVKALQKKLNESKVSYSGRKDN